MVGLNLEIIEPVENEEPATNKQKDFIRALMKEVGASGFPEETLNDLGKWQASSIIEQLKSFQSELHGTKPVDTSRITDSKSDSSSVSDGSNATAIKLILIAAAIGIILYLMLAST